MQMRKSKLLMDNWRYKKENSPAWEDISLPHTYNAEDGTDGGNNYYRMKIKK